MSIRIRLALTFVFLACLTVVIGASAKESVEAQDPYLWLEEVDSEKSLKWVAEINQKTEQSLGARPLYKELYEDALSTLYSKDKLPSITQKGNWIYNYYKDDKHPRGIYRRSSLDAFKSGEPNWQTVLDIDQMSADDGVKWVFMGMDCLAPANQQCLVYLSPGGGDAVELREFDADKLRFVKDGFQLPKSKMRIAWKNAQHLFVSTDYGDGSMTESGYPRIIKLWKRGTPLSQATPILETKSTSMMALASRLGGEKHKFDLVTEVLNFWNNRYYQIVDGKPQRLHLPESARIVDFIDGSLVINLQDDWHFNDRNYQQGSVLLAAPDTLLQQKGEVTVLFESSADTIVEDVSTTANAVLITVLENVKSKVYRFIPTDSGWQFKQIELPSNGQILVETSSDSSDEFFARHEDFVTPPALYAVDDALKVSKVLQQSATFDGSKFKTEQLFTESADGTAVPYFVVMGTDTKLDGSNPTLIFSYGGFRTSLTPSYSGSYEDLNGAYGKMWLERGGVFVLANIRGGGEYGPAWHAAALLENRVKSFEDFEAVAEDLIERKITSPKHLGIEGRSNGGLLVGATMLRRPDLYGAIICGVPLLDMQRYHKLLAGASWMAEFGDPDSEDWQYIKQYSPYQNVKADAGYPPVFFFTSTRDDRVHPGHARKMIAKMMAQGHAVDYYENTEGGHKGSATNEQLAKRIALGYTHLWQHLK